MAYRVSNGHMTDDVGEVLIVTSVCLGARYALSKKVTTLDRLRVCTNIILLLTYLHTLTVTPILASRENSFSGYTAYSWIIRTHHAIYSTWPRHTTMYHRQCPGCLHLRPRFVHGGNPTDITANPCPCRWMVWSRPVLIFSGAWLNITICFFVHKHTSRRIIIKGRNSDKYESRVHSRQQTAMGLDLDEGTFPLCPFGIRL